MKRLGKMTAILAAAAVAVTAFAGCGITTLTAAEPALFDAAIEKWGYSAEDFTEEAAGENDSALVYEAADITDEDGAGEIDYALFADDASAGQYFEAAKEYIESTKTSVSASRGVSGNMFGRYSATSGGIYRVISWIGNTCIYAETDSGNKGRVNDILDELGY